MKKKSLIIAFTLLLAVTNLFAQSVVKILVPEVKEDKILDSLFQKILPDRSPGVRYYYFHINTVGKNETHYNLEEITNIKDTIMMHFYVPIFIENLSYFKYKGITIFTFGGVSPINLIKPNGREKIFIFNWDKELPLRIRPTKSNYDYVNGRLITTDYP